MKKRNSSRLSRLFTKIVFLTIIGFGNLTFAQPGFDDDVDDEYVAAPIDSNILYLFAAGAVLGVMFLKRRQKTIATKN